MKNVIIILATILCFSYFGILSASAQSILKEVSKRHVSKKAIIPDDYGYYFLESNKLKDIRDYSTEINYMVGCDEVRVLDGDRFLVKSGNGISYFKNNTKVSSFVQSNISLISREWDRIIYFEDNDFWLADIKWEDGSSYNKTRLTETGIFGSTRWEIYSWYKESVFLTIQNEAYILNLTDKKLNKLPEVVSKTWETPSGRFFGNGLEYFDFITGKKYTLVSPKHTQFAEIFYSNGKPVIIDELTVGFHYVGVETRNADKMQDHLVVWDLRHPKTPDLVSLTPEILGDVPKITKSSLYTGAEDQITWREGVFTYSMTEATYGRPSNALSPNLEKICFTTFNEPRCIFIQNLTSGNNQLVEENVSKTVGNHYSFSPGNLTFSWTSNDHFIYSKNEGVLEQGTFIFDLTNDEKKKLTPFLIQEIVVLQQVGRVVFRANNKLFTCKSDGSDLEIINEEAYGVISSFLK